jgi:hypothetical protein
MPTYSRRELRQRLGQLYLRDTIVGRTSGSWGTQAGSYNIVDSAQADPTASGEQLYYRHWLRLLGSAGHIQDVRVGSFNTGSGAFVGAQTLATTIYSGMPFEVHALVSPAEKDRALDEVIKDVRYHEVRYIDTIDGCYFYSLGEDVAPDLADIFGVRYLSDPASTLNWGERPVHWWRFEGYSNEIVDGLRYLHIWPALRSSQVLVIDAITTPTLGAGDLATVNLPSDEWILAGAAARCFWALEQRAPGQEAAAYRARRAEAARHYSSLSARFQPVVTRKVQLDEPY